MLKERGILFHTDAVQTVGKIPIDLKKLSVDMLSLSGHKLHAPKGVGALYVRKGTRFSPYIIGGHQEHGRQIVVFFFIMCCFFCFSGLSVISLNSTDAPLSVISILPFILSCTVTFSVFYAFCNLFKFPFV
ncbi:cysteine desulfurase, partial [Candidatus Hakubella thermalkaliphila]